MNEISRESECHVWSTFLNETQPQLQGVVFGTKDSKLWNNESNE